MVGTSAGGGGCGPGNVDVVVYVLFVAMEFHDNQDPKF